MTPETTTVCVVDNGQFSNFAERLARDFKRVLYCVSRDDEMPKFNDACIGIDHGSGPLPCENDDPVAGLDGIEVIDSRDDEACDDAELWVFPDLGFGKTQNKLEAEGKLVWGARMAEMMEKSIVGFKKVLSKVGLPVIPYQEVVGFEALRVYLKTHPDVYVKCSCMRGSWETLYVEDYELQKPELDKREVELSGISAVIPFVVASKMHDVVELAVDAYCVDGKWPSKVLVGMEKKGDCYLGRFMDYAKVPEPLRRVNAAMDPILNGYGYRGPLAFETFIGKDGKPYVSDPACRNTSPCSELQQEFYTNTPEIVLAGAEGRLIDPVPPSGATWGAEVMIQSEWVDRNWQPIRFPDKYRRNIKLGEACRIGGEYKVIPQGIGLTQCGGIIAWSDEPEDAIKQLERIAAEVAGIGIHIPLASFDELREKLEEAKSYGLNILD